MALLTLCLVTGSSVPRFALELLAAARQLSEQLGGIPVQTLLFGSEVKKHSPVLIHYGADQILVADHPSLESPDDEVALNLLEKVVHQFKPQVILLPHNELGGGHLGPRLAYKLKTGIVTDCVGFDVQNGNIRWLRPVYGGKAMVYMRARGPVQIVTIRSRAFEPLKPNTDRQGEVHEIEIVPEILSSLTTVVERVKVPEIEGEISLDRAEIIVSGGRGMGDSQGFSRLRELARVLGAAVGGSRPAVDMGWLPHSHLIGQTGKIVAPKLYIAVGISGAAQHMAGAGGSKTIVAINKDPDAPIFKLAHIGVVEEWEKILPPLIQTLKEMLSK